MSCNPVGGFGGSNHIVCVNQSQWSAELNKHGGAVVNVLFQTRAIGISVQSLHFLPMSALFLSKSMHIRVYICKLIWIHVKIHRNNSRAQWLPDATFIFYVNVLSLYLRKVLMLESHSVHSRCCQCFIGWSTMVVPKADTGLFIMWSTKQTFCHFFVGLFHCSFSSNDNKSSEKHC